VDEAIYLADRVYIMTARPGRIKVELDVRLPRPREREMITSNEFAALKGRVLAALEPE
jgi:ABC-type nitrate/sulfonate/bicarbonate transport system ATPase subunit